MVIAMKEIDFEPYEPESWDEKLFLIWLSRLPPLFRRNLDNRCIPFLIAEMTLANSKITRKEAREILRHWCAKGFLKLYKYKGYRIEPEAITAILNKTSILQFYQNFGLEFVDNPIILNAIAKKANSDTQFWLKNAPHGLGRDKNDK
jgi:hypothetical protein